MNSLLYFKQQIRQPDCLKRKFLSIVQPDATQAKRNDNIPIEIIDKAKHIFEEIRSSESSEPKTALVRGNLVFEPKSISLPKPPEFHGNI